MSQAEKWGWHTLGQREECSCGEVHELPIEACYVDAGAARELAEFARGRGCRRAFVISDENTREADGEQLLSLLGVNHLAIDEKIYPGSGLEATQERADEVAAAGAEADVYVAIGAGTISDLAKSAGSKQGKPVLLYPTAASMNGYTSAIVALKVNGLKRTLPCAPATGIFANPEVVATAPQLMVAAGVADFLSKCSSACDWQAAHMLRGGYYCRRPREFNEGIQERLFAESLAIGRGEPEGIKLVLEALLLSGFGMVMAGSSAPASGGEHLISHYLDMKHALYGSSNDLHGVQVGVSTVYTLGLWEKVLSLSVDAIDIDALVAAQPREEEIQEIIQEDWGDKVGAEVRSQWAEKRLTEKALREELAKFREMLPKLRARLGEDLQPASFVARCIEECGGPSRPEDMAASTKEFKKGLKRARYLRNRFTILDLAAETGVA
ncbi:MAG: iron-containing alcohol dehydrogenase [Candidatus Hydrogenedentes bacterium]|nr:iron-containing alcohol dehydrogenase [Candidatus Hydrogenedentota bacterium]